MQGMRQKAAEQVMMVHVQKELVEENTHSPGQVSKEFTEVYFLDAKEEPEPVKIIPI